MTKERMLINSFKYIHRYQLMRYVFIFKHYLSDEFVEDLLA